MKRDWPLIRKILLWAIDQPRARIGKNPSIEGYSDEEISYHVSLMEQAGLIETSNSVQTIHPDSLSSVLISVTNAGHDFAEQIADETVLNKAIKTATSLGKELALDVIKGLIRSQT